MGMQIISHSVDDTQRIGEHLGRELSPGDIVCLYGNLGSGKTVLTKGLACGVGVPDRERVRSPSFVLIHSYQGRIPVYHADLYRLSGVTEIADIGLREFMGGDGVIIIEWADKLEALLPPERLDIVLADDGEDTRMITIHPQGERYRLLLERCRQAWTTDRVEQRSTGSGEKTLA